MSETYLELPLPEWMSKKNIGKTFQGEFIIDEVIATFHHNGFGIYQLVDVDGYKLIMIGSFATFLNQGQTYKIHGKVTEYKGELRYSAFKADPIKPQNRRGIIAYLENLHGIKTRATKLYDTFGADILRLIVDEPELVASKMSGVGIKTVLSWKEQLIDAEEEQSVLVALLGYGLTHNQVRELFNLYGEAIIHEIKRNPYSLALKVKGYGFNKCDAIAKEIGCRLDSAERVSAAILHLLEEAKRDGHCYLPVDLLYEKVKKILEEQLTAQEIEVMKNQRDEDDNFCWKIGESTYTVPKEAFGRIYHNVMNGKLPHFSIIEIKKATFDEAISNLEAELQIKEMDGRIYEPNLYYAEGDIAKNVVRFLLQDEPAPDTKRIYDAYIKKTGYVLEIKQEEAVLKFSTTRYGIQILCGGAGMGKTFTLNIILKILEYQARLEKRDMIIKIFAPTGRAAKVATVATSREAFTVHKGLEYSPVDGFTYNELNPIDADVVVIDEFSMMDVELTASLFNAIPAHCKVIVIGDTKQLPSVGPGRVLWDLIESGLIPMVELEVTKRQGENSDILFNANKIVKGEMIEIIPDTKDAFLIPKNSVQDAQQVLLNGVAKIISKGEKMKDIQVLVPMRNGEVGTNVLNLLMQERFNHHRDKYPKVYNKTFKRGSGEESSLFFCVGDKVIQTENNYTLECFERIQKGEMRKLDDVGVMNGEIGSIVGINAIKNEDGETVMEMWVKYDDVYVRYVDEFKELDHAFALTIHKSQGSQWKNVFMLIMRNHFRMLDNSIIYTGYTRAREFLCLIGQLEAIELAIKTFNSAKRYTSVSMILKKYLGNVA